MGKEKGATIRVAPFAFSTLHPFPFGSYPKGTSGHSSKFSTARSAIAFCRAS